MTETILRLKPEQLINEIKRGTIQVIDRPQPNERPAVGLAQVEKAKELFGGDFLGEKAIHFMEDQLGKEGINVRFEIPSVSFPYSESDLESAKQDENNDKARMIVLRPEWMTVKEGNRNVRKPVTILNLRELFKEENRDGSGQIISVTYDKNPFGDGAVFYDQNWYDNEDFAKQPLKAGYAMPTKEILPDSVDTTWDDQQILLEPGERRREVNEAVWDMVLYYASTGKKVLESHYDWTSSKTSDGGLVDVGYFDSSGLRLSRWYPSYSYDSLGVCPSR